MIKCTSHWPTLPAESAWIGSGIDI